METVTKNKLYEGMFLVDSAQTGADWDGVIADIRAILEKAGAAIDSMRKWDDRKLAYEIKGKGRGTYILCYFRVDGSRIQEIEKSVRLSDTIMRVLILSAERQGPDDIEKDTPATKLEKEKEKRKVAQEAAREAEAKQVSSLEETGQSEQAEEGEQAEASEQPPEEVSEIQEDNTDSFPASEVSLLPEPSTTPDDFVEKQQGQEQIEDYEKSDEQEQL